MEIWTVREARRPGAQKTWRKESLPLKLRDKPLITVLTRLVDRRRGQIWLVFSREETADLEKLGATLYADPHPERDVLDAVLAKFARTRTGRVYSCLVSPSLVHSKDADSSSRLAIHIENAGN